MIRSLKAQFSLLRASYASVLVLMFLFIPYSYIIGMNYENKDGLLVTYRLEMYLVLTLMMFIYTLMASGIYLPLVLGYGATRKGWFTAMAVQKVASSLVFTLVGTLCCVPLASMFYKAPLQFDTRFIPLVFSMCLFLSAFGEFFGSLGAGKGAKFMIITLIISAVLFLGGFLLAFIWAMNMDFSLLMRSLPLLVAILLALAVAFQLASWLYIKRMPAR